MRTAIATVVTMMLGAGASAQTPDSSRAAGSDARAVSQRVREARYQIGQMERVLEGAVEHGATLMRDRLQALMPADLLLAENARARGFRLDGYGVFFDVEVPSLEGTLAWSLRTLERNDLGLDNALRTLHSFVEASGNDRDLQQALQRVELQVAPARVGVSADSTAAASPRSGGAGPVQASASRPAEDPLLDNPEEAYRAEIREALIDAMLEHSRGLGIGVDERLTVAARRSDDRAGIGVDTDAGTVVLSIGGADLSAFLGGQLSRQDARSRVEVRVF